MSLIDGKIKMKSMLCVMVFVSMGLAACGGGDGDDPDNKGTTGDPNQPVEPPPIAERPLQPQGGPGDDETFEEPDYSKVMTEEEKPNPGAVSDGEELACCELTFAVADQDGEDNESYAMIVGDSEPLSQDGVALTYNDGVWSVSLCVPSNYGGTYHYAFGTMTGEDGDVFEYTTINPLAPNSTEAGEPVNTWPAADSCDAIDLAAHSQTMGDGM